MTPEFGKAVYDSEKMFNAMTFATGAHFAVGQVRKYTGDPYIVHPVAVAETVWTTGASEDAVAAAFLHDVVEDTQISIITIDYFFGHVVSEYVGWLTDYFTKENFPDMNRFERKLNEAKKFSLAPAIVKTIKLADGLSNTPSIAEHDPEFMKTYGPEKRRLLEYLKGGDLGLWDKLDQMLKKEGY